jgi:hypothetical protein
VKQIAFLALLENIPVVATEKFTNKKRYKSAAFNFAFFICPSAFQHATTKIRGGYIH